MNREIIALLSGKGGSGKTAVCISAGKFLAAAGFRVQIIDADGSTHGMTHFFSSQLPLDAKGVFDVDSPHLVTRITLPAEEGGGTLTFIPSTAFTQVSSIEEESSIAAKRIERFLRALDPQESDYILIDCQAGISLATHRILEHATQVLIVTEADPVSIGAVTDLRTIIASRTGASVYGVVGKAFPDEGSYYEALTDYVRDIRFLGVLPHDADVRKAFFRREIPIDLNDPGPFAISLCDILSKMDDRIARAVAESPRLEKFSYDRVAEDVRNLVRLRENLRDEVDYARYRERRLKLLRVSNIVLSGIAVAVITMLYALNAIPDRAALVGNAIAIALIGVAFIGIIIPRQRMTDVRLEEREVLLRDLEKRIDDYVVTGRISPDQLYRDYRLRAPS